MKTCPKCGYVEVPKPSCLNKPFVQDAIVAWLRANPGPKTGREVAEGMGIDSFSANSAMRRLAHKGTLSRYAIPMQCHYPRRDKTIVRGGATKMTYIYSVVEGGE